MTIMIKKKEMEERGFGYYKNPKMTIEATAGLEGVSQSELELDSHIKFIDGMNSSDIQDALIKQLLKRLILMFQTGLLLLLDFFI